MQILLSTETSEQNLTLIRQVLVEYQRSSSDFELNPGWKPVDNKPIRQASVLVPLICRSNSLHILLTLRASQLKYHAGQVAFPGGKVEQYDRNKLATALREAEEEIGIDPSSVEILGQCPTHSTATGFQITPFVGLIQPEFVPRLRTEEVEAMFEVPIIYLMDPTNYAIESRITPLGRRYYYVVWYESYCIWGATARILFGLAKQIEAACA